MSTTTYFHAYVSVQQSSRHPVTFLRDLIYTLESGTDCRHTTSKYVAHTVYQHLWDSPYCVPTSVRQPILCTNICETSHTVYQHLWDSPFWVTKDFNVAPNISSGCTQCLEKKCLAARPRNTGIRNLLHSTLLFPSDSKLFVWMWRGNIREFNFAVG